MVKPVRVAVSLAISFAVTTWAVTPNVGRGAISHLAGRPPNLAFKAVTMGIVTPPKLAPKGVGKTVIMKTVGTPAIFVVMTAVSNAIWAVVVPRAAKVAGMGGLPTTIAANSWVMKPVSLAALVAIYASGIPPVTALA